jgi:hypothetical protein
LGSAARQSYEDFAATALREAAAQVPAPQVEHSPTGLSRSQKRLILVVSLSAALVCLVGLVVYVGLSSSQSQPTRAMIPPRSEKAASKAAAPPQPAKSGPAAEKAAGKEPRETAHNPGSDQPAAKPAPTDPIEWVNAKEGTVSRGDISLKITKAVVGHPGWLGTSTPEKQSEDFLVLWIELSNTSKTRKVDHRGWSPRAGGAAVQLHDEVPNDYRLRAASVGRQGPEPIYPGRSIKDRLVFDRPVETVERLQLELPATVFGAQGVVRFEIPKSMLARGGEESLAASPPAEAKAESKLPSEPGEKVAGKDLAPEAPTGDPFKDFGIKPEPAKPRPSGPPPSKPGAATKENGGRSPGKAAGDTKGSKVEDDDKDTGFKKANKERTSF